MAKVIGSTRPWYQSSEFCSRRRVKTQHPPRVNDAKCDRRAIATTEIVWIIRRSIQFHLSLRLGQESNHRERLSALFRPTNTFNIMYSYVNDRLPIPQYSNPIITSKSCPCLLLPLRLLCGALIKSCFNSIDLFRNYPVSYMLKPQTPHKSIARQQSRKCRRKAKKKIQFGRRLSPSRRRLARISDVHC